MATQVINYSEKAIAVIGDTKAIKEQLKALGGKFNKYLKCGAGWIFSAGKRAEVEAFLNGGAAPEKRAKKSAIDGWEIYVSTYCKYNNGSLEGRWMRLSDYKDKAEFIAACRELHKDETDPEFMFQDANGVPSWLWGESFVSEDIWRWKPEKEQKGAQSLEEKVAILTKYCRKAEGRYRKEATPEQITGWAKNNYFVLEIDGHCFEIAKPSIKTDFCHPDEPAESVKAFYSACRTYEYFEAENMEDLKHSRSRLDNDFAYIHTESWTGESYVNIPCYGQKEEGAEELTDNIKAALKEAYNKAIELHRKRLQTWWKKYGPDKLHCWTYWADR